MPQKAGIVFAGFIEMKKIPVLRDPAIDERTDDPRARKIKQQYERIQHRQDKAQPPKDRKSSVQCSVGFKQMELAGTALLAQLRMQCLQMTGRLEVHHFKRME